MTTTSIELIQGVTFARSLGNIYLAPPVTAGLVAAFEFGGNAESSVKNHAAGHADGMLVGSPAATDQGMVFGPAAYLDTNEIETSSYTLISVARKSALSLALISTLSGSTTSTPFGQLVFRSGDPRRVAVASKTTATSAEVNLGYDFPAGDDGFEFFAGVADVANAQHVLFMPRFGTVTGGNPRAVAFSGTRDVPTAKWRIGAIKVSSSLYAGSTEHACALIYNRALTEAEIRSVYTYLQARLAVAGITI